MENFYLLNDYAGLTYSDLVDDVVNSYCVERQYLDNYNILVAMVEGDGYEESSYFLLMEKSTGDLFEVHGSHCSCYGFEDQFCLEKTEMSYLLSDNAYFGVNDADTRKNIQNFIVTKVRFLKLKDFYMA
jgi:hypothetical protein